ncbi:MAG: hypothetical protein KDK51_01115 [Deltaproteobacteria bacterium]|nr:hypothetical protein [Deltaproteobacteria bacterium]
MTQMHGIEIKKNKFFDFDGNLLKFYQVLWVISILVCVSFPLAMDPVEKFYGRHMPCFAKIANQDLNMHCKDSFSEYYFTITSQSPVHPWQENGKYRLHCKMFYFKDASFESTIQAMDTMVEKKLFTFSDGMQNLLIAGHHAPVDMTTVCAILHNGVVIPKAFSTTVYNLQQRVLPVNGQHDLPFRNMPPGRFYKSFAEKVQFKNNVDYSRSKSYKTFVGDTPYLVELYRHLNRELSIYISPVLLHDELFLLEAKLLAAGYSIENIKDWNYTNDRYAFRPHVHFELNADQSADNGRRNAVRLYIKNNASLVPVYATQYSDERLKFGLEFTSDAMETVFDFIEKEIKTNTNPTMDLSSVTMNFYASSIEYQTFRKVLADVLRDEFHVDNMESFINLYQESGLNDLDEKMMQKLSAYDAFAWIPLIYKQRKLDFITYDAGKYDQEWQDLQMVLENKQSVFEIEFSKYEED